MKKISCSKGSLDQMIDAFKGRINELSGDDIQSSFDYPDDLLDMENGEYTSHATDPVNCSKYSSSDVLDFLSNKGYDPNNVEVKDYAEGVADYLEMCQNAWESTGAQFTYGLSNWYKDTLENYPDDLKSLPRIDSSTSTSGISSRPEMIVGEDSDNYIVSTPIDMIQSVISDLEDEYGLEFHNLNYDSSKPSIEFMYGVPEWGDCAFYTDYQIDPEIFDSLSGRYLDEAYDLLKNAILENYEDNYGPIT